ncbi:hypothetical protein [Streptomyces anulatus]|uniref:hypothetical protein n=1 Tax=Streptomyces anulatus TaxID=1892 RepID=UPI0037DDB9E7|nr:hypothetical protein OG536_39135 [Streptomyces anulatus]WSW88320.1 hypothetical protein OG536_39045 [Streptomyces anulatus]
MSGQEAYEVLPDEDQEQPEPVRLRLVKTAAEAPAPAGRQGLELRSYLPTPRNLRVLLAGVGEGTGVLVGRGWDWLRGEAWDSDSAMKAGGVVFVCWSAGTAALEQWGTYTGYLIPPAVAVWCLIARQHTTLAVAVRTAVREAKEAEGQRLLAEERRKIAAAAKEAVQRRVGGAAEPEPADTADTAVDTADTVEESAVPADDDGVELTADEAAGIIRRVAARHPRHLGVHLSDLLAEPELEGWEQTELKATLTELGLPVSSFKLTFPVGPARTRDGVRLEHLPPVPEAPVGEAGGRAPGEAPQGSPAGVGEGLALVPSQHPAGHRPGTPAAAPSGARPSTPAGTPSGAAGGAPLSPSPTATPAPSQRTG